MVFVLYGCGKKPDVQNQSAGNKMQFSWNQELSVNDIPDFPLKGIIDGKEINYPYLNFEKWHGSNDNVLRFSTQKPEQPCGFIQNFQGIEIIRKGNTIELGVYEKKHFSDDNMGYKVSYITDAGGGNLTKSTSDWNFAMKIDSLNWKTISGKVVVCFNDVTKSWVAVRFSAAVCNN